MDMSNEGGAPSKGRSTAREEDSVCGMQGGKPRRKELRHLLEVEGAESEGRSEKAKREKDRGINNESKGAEGKDEGRRENSETHNVPSKSSIDESRLGKGGHP